METPIYLMIILVILGYAINIVMKWLDVKTNKGKFEIKLWWRTNRLNVLLSVLLIAALLLIYPGLADLITINGDAQLGERAMYLFIGYMPYRIFKAVLKKAPVPQGTPD